MIELKDVPSTMPKILVMGIGGGGNNAVNRMVDMNTSPHTLEYISINTDQMVLNLSKASRTLTIGPKLTGGYGAGGNPEIGCASAEESEEAIKSLLADCNMVILTAGMGGGTGTGAIPVIAKLCHELNILTVAVVTKPFSFEGTKKMKTALSGIEKLKEYVDTLFIIPNDKLVSVTDKNLTVENAFLLADSVLKDTINAITNIIHNCGLVNLDFNDLKTILGNKGIRYIGISAMAEKSAIIDTMKEALNSPFLETSVKGATHILINCSAGLNLQELNTAIGYVREIAGNNADIMWGTVTDSDNSGMNNSVTIIATGLPASELPSTPAGSSVSKVPSPPSPNVSGFPNMPTAPKSLQPTVPLKPIILPDFIKNI